MGRSPDAPIRPRPISRPSSAAVISKERFAFEADVEDDGTEISRNNACFAIAQRSSLGTFVGHDVSDHWRIPGRDVVRSWDEDGGRIDDDYDPAGMLGAKAEFLF